MEYANGAHESKSKDFEIRRRREVLKVNAVRRATVQRLFTIHRITIINAVRSKYEKKKKIYYNFNDERILRTHYSIYNDACEFQAI